MAPGQAVFAAGVRVATQTPPTSGTRVLFATLADSSGLIDVAFAADPHEACAQTVFHSELLLVRGTIEARGRRGAVAGEAAWDLQEVAAGGRDELRHITDAAASPVTLQVSRM
jgi:error-prone DNA polymerase